MPLAILPQVIDASIIDTFRTCPRKAYYSYILGLTPHSKNLDLVSGAAFAAALEHYYKTFFSTGSASSAIIAAFRIFTHEWGDLEVFSNTPKTFENVWAAVVKYFEVYPPETDPFKLTFNPDGSPCVEFTFAVPLTDPIFPLHPVTREPFIYAGRLDAFGTYRGVPCARDEKTTKNFSDYWISQWDSRSQFIGGTWALQQMGLNVNHYLVRGIAFTKEIQFLDHMCRYSNHLREEWKNSLAFNLHQIVTMWDREFFVPNLGSACTSYSKECLYKELCVFKPDEIDYMSYTTSRWNPLTHGEIS